MMETHEDAAAAIAELDKKMFKGKEMTVAMVSSRSSMQCSSRLSDRSDHERFARLDVLAPGPRLPDVTSALPRLRWVLVVAMVAIVSPSYCL
jgi:hypothetical protein